MIEISIPGYQHLRLDHLVLDFNGTLAVGGLILEGVREALNTLAQSLRVHVLTADTFGRAAAELEGVDCTLTILPQEDQARGKLEYVEKLTKNRVAAVGNGRNDRLMLKGSALGIALVQGEGAASETIQAADLVCSSVLDALALLQNPLRLKATLRS